MSTFSGKRFDLFLVTIFPTTENILSDETDVAGTHNFFAYKDNAGNLTQFFLHHSRGLEFGTKSGSSMKYSNSSLREIALHLLSLVV